MTLGKFYLSLDLFFPPLMGSVPDELIHPDVVENPPCTRFHDRPGGVTKQGVTVTREKAPGALRDIKWTSLSLVKGRRGLPGEVTLPLRLKGYIEDN